jgi:membrane protein YdbS with pleckstrin-like domain
MQAHEDDAAADADRPVTPDFTAEELAGLRFGGPPGRILPLDDDPSQQTARFLLPREKFRGEWRHHWISPLWSLAFIVTYTVLLAILAVRYLKPQYVAWGVTLLVLGALLLTVHRVLRWWSDRLVVTNKRLMLLRGALSRNVAMVPLLRVTDLRYLQSPLGRMLNYGTFRIESAPRRSGLRRIANLPNPNELYLRIVEEMYDPEAIEERLGGVVSSSLREAFGAPVLSNYDGWVSVELRSGGVEVTLSDERELPMVPGRPVEVSVTIAADRLAGLAERLDVHDGQDHDEVTFFVELDSDQRALRRGPVSVQTARGTAGRAQFWVELTAEELALRPWLWIRVSQEHHTLQSIELVAVAASALR